MADYENLVVGGGLHACYLAAHLAERGERTLLIDPRPSLLADQLPGSTLSILDLDSMLDPRTPRQSTQDVHRFLAEFRPCLDPEQISFVAIGRASPKLSASQLHSRCSQLGLAIDVACESVRRLFDPALIEAVFRIESGVFQVDRLRHRLHDRLADAGVEVQPSSEVEQVLPLAGGTFHARLTEGFLRVRRVINCSKAGLNVTQRLCGLPALPVRYELTEQVIVETPPELRHFGLTILNGPIFKLSPLGEPGRHVLRHERFLPHAAWSDLGEAGPSPDEILGRIGSETGFERMRREVSRFAPSLGNLRFQRSAWQVEAKPLDPTVSCLIAHDCGRRNVHAVLAGRLEEVYFIIDRFNHQFAWPLLSAA